MLAVLKQRLIRLFYPYGKERRVLRGYARGMRFIVERGIGSTYALGTDTAAPRFFARHISRSMTVYDVGANKGQMALLFASLVGVSGRVVALEPAPDEFASLLTNLRLNECGHVTALQVAASDSDGECLFKYDADRPTQGRFTVGDEPPVSHETTTLSVRAVRLDTLLETAPPPNFIKIDVEGAAAQVLRGASRILDEVGPSVYVELHGPEEQEGVRDELLSRGYVAETVDGAIVSDPVGSWHSPLWCYKA